jgi:truncated hemoglobin YjbI
MTANRIANRPMDEIVRAANPALIWSGLREYSGRRYAENAANRHAGYVQAERAAWVASITAATCAEVWLAWKCAITLNAAFRDLDTIRSRA